VTQVSSSRRGFLAGLASAIGAAAVGARAIGSWPLTLHGVPVVLNGGYSGDPSLIVDLLERRVEEGARVLREALTRQLYSDDVSDVKFGLRALVSDQTYSRCVETLENFDEEDD
jgi:hypothetical protein